MVLFAMVAEFGSFSEAARRAGLQTSTVSRRIRSLEEHLDARLIERSTRQLLLTEAGERLLPRAQDISDARRDAIAAVQDVQADLRGPLRVTAALPEGETFLSDWLATFLQSYPQIQLHLTLTDRNVDLIAERIDVAFRLGPLQDSSLVATPLGLLSQGLFASPQYLREHLVPETVEQLCAHRLLGYQNPKFDREWIFEDGQMCVGPFSCVVDSMASAARMAAVGAGIARLPTYVAEAFVAQGALVSIRLDTRFAERKFYAVVPRRAGQTRKTRELIDYCKAQFSAG